jgi:hypothetical protein
MSDIFSTIHSCFSSSHKETSPSDTSGFGIGASQSQVSEYLKITTPDPPDQDTFVLGKERAGPPAAAQIIRTAPSPASALLAALTPPP